MAQHIKLHGIDKLPLIPNPPKFHYINESDLPKKPSQQTNTKLDIAKALT